MQQLVLRQAYWLTGSKWEVMEQLNRLGQIYGDIPLSKLLKLLQN
jgi:hypothetical protein